jgi:hypothetical protein
MKCGHWEKLLHYREQCGQWEKLLHYGEQIMAVRETDAGVVAEPETELEAGAN